MGIDVLLPGGKWRGGTKKGFCKLEIRDIEENNLAVLEEILPGSIPNIWSNALHFSWVLKRTGDITLPQERAMNLLELYLKGLFVQVLTLEKLTLDEKSMINYLLRIHNPMGNDVWEPENLLVLKYNNKTVAVNYPESIFAPTAQNSAWPDDPSANPLESEMADDINAKFAELKDDGREAFESWIQEILNKGSENPPWHRALLGKGRMKVKFSEEMRNRLKITNELTDTYTIKAANGKFLKEIISIPIRTYVPLGEGEIPDLNKIFGELSLFQGQIVHKDKIIIPKEECEQAGIVYIEKTDKTYAWQRPKNKLRGIIDIQYQEDGFTLIFGKSKKNFKAKILSDDNFFVNKIYALKREITNPEGYSTVDYLVPNLPVKEYEYRDLIRKSEIKDVAQVPGEIRGQLTYVMDIIGREVGERKNISFDKLNEISPILIIWPNFKDDRWKLYYIYNYVAGKQKKDASFSFYFDIVPVGDSKIFFEKIEDPSKEVIQKDRPPAAFSLSIKNSPCGIYFINELVNLKSPNEPFSAFEEIKQTTNSSKKCEIGIDFGTSSTCISYKEGNEDPKILILNFKTAKILHEEGKYYSLNFIPEIPQKTIPSVLRVIPSLFNEEKYAEQAYSAYNFSPMLFSKDKLEEIPGQEIYRELKWGEEKYRRSFLFLIFKHIFFEIRTQGKEEIDFRVSFPLAFDGHQLQNYIKLCTLLINELYKKTEIKSNYIEILSESEAGSYFVKSLRTGKIVLDMGGETTDIYIKSPDGVVLADSIRFAGGHILDSIIKKVRFLKEYEDKRKTSKDYLNDSIIFKLRGGVVKFENMMDEDNRKDAFHSTSDGKEIIFEYIRRLLFAGTSQQVISDLSDKPAEIKNSYEVFLIGRGWSLNVGENILELLQKYMDVDKYEIPTDFDPKEALAIGILKASGLKRIKVSDKIDDNSINELLKDRITYICAKCEFKAPKDDSIRNLEWTDKIPFECKSDISLGGRTTNIELRVIDLYPNTIIKKMIDRLKGGIDGVNYACLGKFNLSTTSKNINAITASPFATMIENAFKKYLET